MKWKVPTPFNEFEWHNHFLWKPIQIDSNYFWLCTVHRRRTLEGKWEYNEAVYT